MFENTLFLLAATLTVAGAIGVVVTRNIMHACIYLLASLIGTAGLYLTLAADFVAVTQVMVYVGGVVILMIFAVMLTGGKDFVSKTQQLLGLIPSMGNKWSYSIGLLVSAVFVFGIYRLIAGQSALQTTSQLKFETTVEEIGKLLITDHVLAFEISSVLLLGALVGAAIIARPRQ